MEDPRVFFQNFPLEKCGGAQASSWKEDDGEEEYRKLIKGTRASSLKAKRIVSIVDKLSEGNKKKQQRKIGLTNLNHPLHRDLKYFIVFIQGLIYQNNDRFRR